MSLVGYSNVLLDFTRVTMKTTKQRSSSIQLYPQKLLQRYDDRHAVVDSSF